MNYDIITLIFLGVIMAQVIVENGFGNVSVYLATMENAKKIFENHLDAIDPEAIQIYKLKKKVLNKDKISQIINKILSGEEGSMASKTITVSRENKQEVVMYCFNKKININNNRIDEYAFFKDFKIVDLSFFANNENYDMSAEIVDEYVIEQSQRYSVIQEDKWREGAKDLAKINYIINFANELAHRDVKYEVTELKEIF